jgi:phosphotransferase system HPr-like phosphotransfer protein
MYPVEVLFTGEVMSHDEHDVVKVYSGDVVTAELYQQTLKEAGVESNVTGLSLTASFGSALNNSVELIVKSEDEEKALAAIKQYESEKKPAEE